MNFTQDYMDFTDHITDKENMGEAGPVEFSREEDSFARFLSHT